MTKEALTQVAGRQHGLFSRRQALDAGLTSRQVDYGARHRNWLRVHRGVYRMAGAPVTEAQRLLAAVLACGPRAAASHRGAGWAWGMTTDLVTEVTSPHRARPGAGIVVHQAEGDPRRVFRRGIPCTDPLRTVLDLAALGDRSLVERGIDRGIATGLFPVTSLEAELGRRAVSGRPGVRLLRSCLAERLDGAGGRTSCLESPMDRLIVRQRLPLPERQHWVADRRFRLDYAWPAARLAVEVDGYEDHSGLAVFRSDRERQNVLVLLGWTVLRFTWADVHHRPGRVAEQVRRALAVRGSAGWPA